MGDRLATTDPWPEKSPYQVESRSIRPFGHNTSTLQAGQTEEWSRSIRWTVTCNGRPKTAVNDARLATTPKPEVEIWRNRINEHAVVDFVFDFNTIYGRIHHRLAAKKYLQSDRTFESNGRRHLGFLKFRNVKGRKDQ